MHFNLQEKNGHSFSTPFAAFNAHFEPLLKNTRINQMFCPDFVFCVTFWIEHPVLISIRSTIIKMKITVSLDNVLPEALENKTKKNNLEYTLCITLL